MFNASRIINNTIVQKCKSADDDCVNNLIYPCDDICPGKVLVKYFIIKKYFFNMKSDKLFILIKKGINSQK